MLKYNKWKLLAAARWDRWPLSRFAGYRNLFVLAKRCIQLSGSVEGR